ncbi:MAG: hypothetical protein FVQ77_12525 [Cytophagales bacterium]|nr:hypothetical protein [Cytophagales bacterium]
MITQYITDDHGKTLAVVVPVKDYEKIMEELDEFECIKAYDKVKARKQEFVPAADVFKSIEQKRKHL